MNKIQNIRVNQHGNVDIHRRVPKLVRHFGYNKYGSIRIRTVCNAVGSPYADALVGFTKVGRRSFPRFDGGVVPCQYEAPICLEINRRRQLALKRHASAKRKLEGNPRKS